MEENMITIDGNHIKVPEPFMVIGTQNPAEMAGTYPLPESQLDRFMMKLSVGYPDANASADMAKRYLDGSLSAETTAVLSSDDILKMQAEVKRVAVQENLCVYAANIAQGTRDAAEVFVGASPRALLALLRCTLYEIEDGRSITLGVLGKDELTSAINCKYAGAYDIGIETVAFTDPFKIFTVRLDIPYSFRVIVSPRVTDIADKVLDLENQVNNSGFKSSNLMEDSPGNDLREYIKGDPLKAINWKVSAKQSKLIVRVPEPMEKRTVTILLQASDIPESEQDIEYLKRRDQFLEFAVSAAYHFGKRGVPIRLIYPSGTVTESIVNSYESFLEFYNMAADGIYYGQADAFTEIANLSKEIRNNERGSDTYIIIREDYENPEDFCTICG